MKTFCLIIFCLLCANTCLAKIVSPIQIAQQEIGNGEIGGDNNGCHVKKYLNGKERLPWCSGFVSYCLITGGVKIPYTLRAKDFCRLGNKVKTPSIGDILILDRGNNNGHVGIVEKVTNTEIITIEGNVGKFPARVKRVVYKKGYIPNFIEFRRIK